MRLFFIALFVVAGTFAMDRGLTRIAAALESHHCAIEQAAQ